MIFLNWLKLNFSCLQLFPFRVLKITIEVECVHLCKTGREKVPRSQQYKKWSNTSHQQAEVLLQWKKYLQASWMPGQHQKTTDRLQMFAELAKPRDRGYPEGGNFHNIHDCRSWWPPCIVEAAHSEYLLYLPWFIYFLFQKCKW